MARSVPQGDNRLNEMADRLHEAVMAEAVAACEVVVRMAQGLVPVGPEPVHLKEAIHLEVDDDEEVIEIVAGNNKAWYGHIVEHGSVKTAPRPFLMPAFEVYREEIVKAMAAGVRKATS